MNQKRIVVTGLALAALAFLPALGGCSGSTKSGTPYTLKVDREMRAYVPVDLETTHTTAIRMLKDDYLYTILDEAMDAREGVVRARTARGKTIRVESEYIADDRTRVDLFVGPFGSVSAMTDMMETLEDRLGVEFVEEHAE